MCAIRIGFPSVIFLVVLAFSGTVFANSTNPVHHPYYPAKTLDDQLDPYTRSDNRTVRLDFSDAGETRTAVLWEAPSLRYVHEPAISPMGRYVTFIESGDSRWHGRYTIPTKIYLHDRANGVTKQVSPEDPSGSFRYLEPLVSDNGLVSYVRTPSGNYTDISQHEVYLYNPDTESTTRLDSDCATPTPVANRNNLIYRTRQDTGISGDGRFVVYREICHAPGSGNIYSTHLFDRVANTTNPLSFGAQRIPITISVSGRVVQFGSMIYDQLTEEASKSGSIDCLDPDGDGWGEIAARSESCRVADFENQYPECDYLAAVSSSGVQSCAYSRAAALTTASGDCVNRWNGTDRCDNNDRQISAENLVSSYLQQTVALNTGVNQLPGLNNNLDTGTRVQLITAPEFSGGQCVDNLPLNDGWGWNGDCTCSLDPSNLSYATAGFGDGFDVDGDVAAIGTNTVQFSCQGSGGLSIFEKNTGTWEHKANLIPSSRNTGDGFPAEVAVSDNTVAASSLADDHTFNLTVFQNNGNDQWTEKQVISTGIYRGNNADHMIDMDGDHIVVPNTNSSNVHIYTRDTNDVWMEQIVQTRGTVYRAEVLGDTLAVSNYGGEIFVYRYINRQWQYEALLSNSHIPTQFGAIILRNGGPQFSMGQDVIITGYTTFIRNPGNDWSAYPQTNEIVGLYYRNSVYSEPFPISRNSLVSVHGSQSDAMTAYMFQNDVWQPIDTLQSSEFRYTTELRFDGTTVLTPGFDNNMVSLTVDANGNFAGVESQTEPQDNSQGESSSGCDYSNASLYDGWGWNNITRASCAPLNQQPEPEMITEQGECDYTNASLYSGWGWNPVTSESCPPLHTNVSETGLLCIDTDGDGWGWNGIDSCRITATTCIDTDGDGWGWDGSASCVIE